MGGITTANTISANSETVLDQDILVKLESGVGGAVVVRLSALFCAAVDSRIVALQQAREVRDFETLRQVAHDWISDAAALGALQLSAAARRVDTAALAGDENAWADTHHLADLARAAQAALTKRYGEAA
ncbi:MAG: hypothetical protein IH872_06810 [Chloroflexi bacterium]|nr:hypothetical protein [Chloroflexota bacterium]